MTEDDLAAIEARCAAEVSAQGKWGPVSPVLRQDIPAMAAEIRRLRGKLNPVLQSYDGEIGWGDEG